MTYKHTFLAAVAALAFTSLGAWAVADPAEAPAEAPEFKLPPGWTMEDIQACIQAATPGKMHQLLAEGVGEWQGTSTFWMGPEADPTETESISTVSPFMDGRFVKCEMKCEIPGMGPYQGFGIVGYDNVAKQFVATWIDSQGTGMMTGTGKLSEDGKQLVWKYTFNCPITGKPTPMRQVETFTGKDSKTLEMYSQDPKTGKEFKAMTLKLTRK